MSWAAIAILVFWLVFPKVGILLIALSLTGIAIGVGIPTFINYLQAKNMKSDVFFGLSYGSSLFRNNTSINESTAFLTSAIFPTWGIVTVLQPIDQSLASENIKKYSYGDQWPFVLYCTKTEDWKESVEWLLSRCKVAIFDTTDDVSSSLQWEIDLALNQLGRSRVILLKRLGNRLHWQLEDKPFEPDFSLPQGYSSKLDTEKLKVSNQIRQWLRNEVYIDELEYRKRKQIYQLDGLSSLLSITFLVLSPIGLIAGLIMLLL